MATRLESADSGDNESVTYQLDIEELIELEKAKEAGFCLKNLIEFLDELAQTEEGSIIKKKAGAARKGKCGCKAVHG